MSATRGHKAFHNARLKRARKACDVRGAFARALAFHQGKSISEARALYQEILRAFPEHFDALHHLGVCELQTGHLDAAQRLIGRALAINPRSAAAHCNFGIVLFQLNRFHEALASYDRAIALRADYAEALYNKGNALRGLKRLEEAAASYDKAVVLNPEFAAAFNNRGECLKHLLRVDAALASYDRAIALHPGDAQFHLNRALCRLLAGCYTEGWKEYEWRRDAQDFLSKRPNIAAPDWQGEELSGRNLLVVGEQGFGDVIQFARYLPLLAEKRCHVTCLADARLVHLLASSMRQIRFVREASEVGGVDLQVGSMSLPFWLDTDLDSIPANVPYIRAPAERVAKWRDRLPPRRPLRVGLVWSGNPALATDTERSIAWGRLRPFLTDERVELVSLVRDLRDEDAPLLGDHGILHLGNELEDFADAAAVISLLDLVISVDTSVAHLAGAMAKPVWILLPFSPDFRWMLDRADSPWYPTARLFRQPKAGDWDSVLARVQQELRGLS